MFRLLLIRFLWEGFLLFHEKSASRRFSFLCLFFLQHVPDFISRLKLLFHHDIIYNPDDNDDDQNLRQLAREPALAVKACEMHQSQNRSEIYCPIDQHLDYF